MTTPSERIAELKALINADERERCENGLTQHYRAELDRLQRTHPSKIWYEVRIKFASTNMTYRLSDEIKTEEEALKSFAAHKQTNFADGELLLQRHIVETIKRDVVTPVAQTTA